MKPGEMWRNALRLNTWPEKPKTHSNVAAFFPSGVVVMHKILHTGRQKKRPGLKYTFLRFDAHMTIHTEMSQS